MERTKLLFVTIAFFVFILGCNNESQDKSKDSKSNKVECVYSLVKDSSSVNWTAFKTNARVGVKGHFDEFDVKLPKKVNSAAEALVGTSFNIVSKSVNTGDKVRDPKLVKFFFWNFDRWGYYKGRDIIG